LLNTPFYMAYSLFLALSMAIQGSNVKKY